MSKKQTLIFAVLNLIILSKNVNAEIICNPIPEIDSQSNKPSQIQHKSIDPKTDIINASKSTKHNLNHLDILKLLIPNSLR